MPENIFARKIMREGKNFLSEAWDYAAGAENIYSQDSDIWQEALRSANICVLAQTADLIYIKAENLPACLRAKWHEGCSEEDLFSAETAAEMRHVKQQILAGSGPAKLEVKLPAFTETESGGKCDLWLRFFINAWRDESGALLGIITAGIDISELRARDAVLKSLLREVSHRSKNLLAIIQSIAAQTARFSPDGGDFLKKFQGRLQSLSASQDLITAADWHGARLRELMQAQIRCCPDVANNNVSIKLEGENPHLTPSAALYIGLALHELIVNSAAFGALAKGEGSVALSCGKRQQQEARRGASPDREEKQEMRRSVSSNRDEYNAAGRGVSSDGEGDQEKEENILALKWIEKFPPEKESDGGEIQKNSQAQFGSAVLTRIVPEAVGGKAFYAVKNSSIEYSLAINIQNYTS